MPDHGEEVPPTKRPTYEQLATCVVQLRDDVDCLVGAIERAGLEGHPMLVDVLERVADG